MTPTTLTGSKVRLEPLDVQRDSQALFAASNGSSIDFNGNTIADYDSDALIWRYMGVGPFTNLDHYEKYLQALVSNENGLAMCVFDASEHQVGVATFMNNFPEHLKVELGNIWYSPVVQGKGANMEATYLMLKHAFSLGYRRLEWKCDALNERSRRAALCMGFSFECVQEFHFIVKGRNRDTAWFRMLDHEWQLQKRILESMIY
jgi:RimJ/RimL family protein N-acetyltransferase